MQEKKVHILNDESDSFSAFKKYERKRQPMKLKALALILIVAVMATGCGLHGRNCFSCGYKISAAHCNSQADGRASNYHYA